MGNVSRRAFWSCLFGHVDFCRSGWTEFPQHTRISLSIRPSTQSIISTLHTDAMSDKEPEDDVGLPKATVFKLISGASPIRLSTER